MALRSRLLQDVDFGKFSPMKQYVKGWPCQLWEAVLGNSDAKILLYEHSKTGTFNVRAFSSMRVEAFISEVSNQDKTAIHGTLTAYDFAHFMSSTVEQMNMSRQGQVWNNIINILFSH